MCGEAATATHYDVLGVARDAGHDEIKRAFTAKALAYHPDRQADRSPAALERSAWRMQEINAAWAVLRSPSSRAAYDAELRAADRARDRSAQATRASAWSSESGDTTSGAATGPTASSRGWHTPTGTTPFARAEPEVADVEPVPPAGAPASTTGWFRQFLPVLVILGVLGFVLVVTAYASTRPKDIGVQTKERFAPGSCVVVTLDGGGRQVADEVPCSGPNSGRVVTKVDYPRPCPLGTVLVPFPADKVSLCLSPSRP